MKQYYLYFFFIFIFAPECWGQQSIEDMPISFGIVYPSSALAIMKNPSILSLCSNDHIELQTTLPFTYNEKDQSIDKIQSATYPVYLSYGGSPKPFGVGGTIIIEDNEPKIYAGGGFGTDKLQLGYAMYVEPLNNNAKTHYYNIRIGAMTGPSFALNWNSRDNYLTSGLGYRYGIFLGEIDTKFNLNYSEDPTLEISLGVLYPLISFALGFGPSPLKNLTASKRQDYNASISIPFKEKFHFNLYFQKYFAEFAIGLLFDF